MDRTDYSLPTGFDPEISPFPRKDSLEAQIGRFFASRRAGTLQPLGHNALIYALALGVNRQPRASELRRDYWDRKDIREYLLRPDYKRGFVDWSMPEETCFAVICDSFLESQPQQVQTAEELKKKSPGFSEDENLEAFLAELPRLLEEKRGQYALIIDGEVVRTDPDESALLEYAYTEFPDKDGLIQPIQETLPVFEMGGAATLAE